MTTDRDAWWDGLGQDDKLRVLGADKLAALEDGRIGWDDLARLVDNPNWRPSYRPVPKRDLAGV